MARPMTAVGTIAVAAPAAASGRTHLKATFEFANSPSQSRRWAWGSMHQFRSELLESRSDEGWALD